MPFEPIELPGEERELIDAETRQGVILWCMGLLALVLLAIGLYLLLL
jgi:hypothetical protein